MEDTQLKLILSAFLAAQREANQVLLKALGYQEANQAQQLLPHIGQDTNEDEKVVFFPDIEFDPAMEGPELWPEPDVYRLSDIPRRVETVGEIE